MRSENFSLYLKNHEEVLVMIRKPDLTPGWYRTLVAEQKKEAEAGAANIRDAAQKRYECLFEKMLQNEGKIKKGVTLLSYRPRPYCHTPEDIEKVLGEVENFLRNNIPGVKIPPRPAILRRVSCRSSF